MDVADAVPKTPPSAGHAGLDGAEAGAQGEAPAELPEAAREAPGAAAAPSTWRSRRCTSCPTARSWALGPILGLQDDGSSAAVGTR